MTASQEAKDFAVANRFNITTNGRRYVVSHDDDGIVVEVGGYPAALNAMRMYVPLADRTLRDVVIDEPIPAGAKFTIESMPDGTLRSQVFTPNAHGPFADAVGATIAARPAELPPGTSVDMPKPFRFTPGDDIPFDEFNDASKARIRAAATKMRAKKPLPARWVLRIEYNGIKFAEGRYACRADAVKESRREMNESRMLYGAGLQNRIATIGYAS